MIDKRRKSLKNCMERSKVKCMACSKCWVGCVLAEDAAMTACAGCKSISPVLDKTQPCPSCGSCGSLAWMVLRD
jgi:hypothetical protein